jgi:hypothetical protein
VYISTKDISWGIFHGFSKLLPVLACTVDSALIYIMMVKDRNTICPSPLQLLLHRRVALSTNSKGTQYPKSSFQQCIPQMPYNTIVLYSTTVLYHHCTVFHNCSIYQQCTVFTTVFYHHCTVFRHCTVLYHHCTVFHNCIESQMLCIPQLQYPTTVLFSTTVLYLYCTVFHFCTVLYQHCIVFRNCIESQL